MPVYNFLACFKAEIIEPMPQKLKLHIHLTKSPKCDHIYKLCLWMLEQQSCLILLSYHVPTLRYRAHAQKCKPLLHCTKSLKRKDIKIFY